MEHLEGTIEQLMEQNKYKLHERMNWALETAHGFLFYFWVLKKKIIFLFVEIKEYVGYTEIDQV